MEGIYFCFFFSANTQIEAISHASISGLSHSREAVRGAILDLLQQSLLHSDTEALAQVWLLGFSLVHMGRDLLLTIGAQSMASVFGSKSCHVVFVVWPSQSRDEWEV